MTKEDLFKKHGVSSYKIIASKDGVLYVFGNSQYREVNGVYEYVRDVKKVKQASGIPKTLGRRWSR